MSKAAWLTPAHRRPLVHSSDIPLHQADGLDAWLSQTNILGSEHYKIRPMFNMTRGQLEQAIADGIFPKPGRVLENGKPNGILVWPAATIKAYVEQCEAEQAAKLAATPVPAPVPDGYSTTGDLVKLLGVSRQTIHNYVKSGKIPRPTRYNGKPYWSPEQIRAIYQADIEAVDGDYIRLKDLLARLGISRDTLQEWILAGKFPAPIVVTGRAAWPASVLVKLEQEAGA